jgi:hypothetical protein
VNRSVSSRRRVILVVLVLALLELAVPFAVTGRLTLANSAPAVICVVSSLFYLWRTRGRP